MANPTKQAIVLAAFVAGREWLYGDEIRGHLVRLGFEPSTQQVSGWLAAMCREDAPRFEKQCRYGTPPYEYRLTRWALNELDNNYDGLHDDIYRVRARLNPPMAALGSKERGDG